MATTRGPEAARIRGDFGPTLPALLQRRFGVPERVTAAVAVLFVLVAIVAVVLRPYVGDKQLVHRAEPVFNLVYSSGVVHRVAPRHGELVRLEARRGTLSLAVIVRNLRLPAYAGNVSFGLLPVYEVGYERRLRRRSEAFKLRDEGRARVHDAPGYQLGFRAGRPGRFTWGRDILLLPKESGVRDGVVLSFRQTKVGSKPNAQDQKVIDAAKNAFRSFHFGTDRD